MIDAKIDHIVPLVQGKRVLDLGVVQHAAINYSSESWLHRAIVAHSRETLGLDIDQKGAEFLRKEGFNVVTADAQDFSLDRRFDVVVAGDLIEHLSNHKGFLDSVKRHLESNGQFIITTPNPFWWKHWIHALTVSQPRPHPQHTCWFCPLTISELLRRGDFVVKRIEWFSVYSESMPQRILRFISKFLLLPKRVKHNTFLIIAEHATC